MSKPCEGCQREDVACTCRVGREMNAELREQLADIQGAHEAVISEKCGKDEMHCTCVPFLRREIKALKEQLAAVTKERDKARADSAHWMRQHEVIRAEREDSFAALSNAVEGVGMTPAQPEVDLEILGWIMFIKSELAKARAEAEAMMGEMAIALNYIAADPNGAREELGLPRKPVVEGGAG